MLNDPLAESDARHQAADHFLDRLLGGANRAHTMMDAAGSKPTLRDLEATSFTEKQILDRHPHVLEHDIAMAMGCIVIAENWQVAQDRDARRIARHENHALLTMARRVGAGLAHNDHYLAPGIKDAASPPLAAVYDIMIAIPHYAGLDVGCVRASRFRFGHQESGTDLARHQRMQPAIFLCSRTVTMEDFHVSGIRR